MINNIKKKLAAFRDKKAIIFGTSYEGRLTFNILAKYNIIPVAFIDNNLHKQGSHAFGINILSPDILTRMNDFIVIVPTIYYKPMYLQLIAMGIPKNLIFNIDIYNKTNVKYDTTYKLKLYLYLNKFNNRKV